jgi:hypothetical protein
MDIKELLGEDLYLQVAEKLGDKKIMFNDGNYIPKNKFDEKNEELKLTKGKLDEVQNSLQQLGQTSQEAEQFKNELQKIKQEYDNFKNESETRLTGYKKKQAVEKALYKENANPDTIDLLLTQFDYNNIMLDNSDNIVDWQQHITPIKETRKSLFASESYTGDKPQSGYKPQQINNLSTLYKQALEKGDRLGAIKIKQEAFKNGEIL